MPAYPRLNPKNLTGWARWYAIFIGVVSWPFSMLLIVAMYAIGAAVWFALLLTSIGIDAVARWRKK